MSLELIAINSDSNYLLDLESAGILSKLDYKTHYKKDRLDVLLTGYSLVKYRVFNDLSFYFNAVALFDSCSNSILSLINKQQLCKQSYGHLLKIFNDGYKRIHVLLDATLRGSNYLELIDKIESESNKNLNSGSNLNIEESNKSIICLVENSNM